MAASATFGKAPVLWHSADYCRRVFVVPFLGVSFGIASEWSSGNLRDYVAKNTEPTDRNLCVGLKSVRWWSMVSRGRSRAARNQTFLSVVWPGVHNNPTKFGDLGSLLFHPGFSHISTSFPISTPNPHIFDLTSSLSLLGDLTLGTNGIDDNVLSSYASPAVVRPSTSPTFTGTLNPILFEEMGAGHWTYQNIFTSGSSCFVTSQGRPPVDNCFGG